MTLRSKVLSGLLWAGGGRLVAQLLTWAVTIVVIRLLSPQDYGLLAMAMLFVGLFMMLGEGGFGAALIQMPEVNESKLKSIFGTAILIHVALFLIQIASAPLVAGFFGEHQLVLILRVLAIHFLLDIFAVIPGAILGRKLDFKRPSIIGLASTIVTSATTLGLALLGHGVWALVIGTLVGRAVHVAALNAVSPYLKWPDFSLRETRGVISFGAQVTGTRLLWLVYSQADVFIAGKLLGKDLLGFYSVAMHLASLPVQRIAGVLNTVAFPAFTQIQEDRDRVASHLLKVVRLVGMVGFPVTWGLASVSPEAVNVLLGEKWGQAILPLQLIALVMPLRILSTLLPSATDAIGRPDVALKNLFIASLVMPVAFFVGCRWGIAGLSMAWVLVYPLVVFQNVYRSAQAIGMSMRSVWSAAARPFAAAFMVCVAVAGTRELLPPGMSEVVKLVLLIASGVVVYGGASWVMNRQGLMELRDLLRRP